MPGLLLILLEDGFILFVHYRCCLLRVTVEVTGVGHLRFPLVIRSVLDRLGGWNRFPGVVSEGAVGDRFGIVARGT